MAKIQLQIQGDTTNFAFDVEGEYFPRLDPVFRANANPPILVEMREVWEFRNCRIVSTNGTPPTLWTSRNAFLERFRKGGTGASEFPTFARVVHDPAGAATVLLTLGPPTYEQFQVDEISGGPDPDVAAASDQVTSTWTIVVSAADRRADADGVVGLEQEVTNTYEAGLRTVQWDTLVTTKEGVNAETVLQAIGALDVANFGSDFAYETGNHENAKGVNVEYTDADERMTVAHPTVRIPTVAQGISRLRQYAVDIGTSAPGGSPDQVRKTVRVKTTAEEIETTTTVFARGPSFESFLETHAPQVFDERDVVTVESGNEATGVWVRREASTGGGSNRQDGTKSTMNLKVELSGGRSARVEPVANGLAPLKFGGAFVGWQAIVTVVIDRIGGTGELQELPLPGLAPAPWFLIEPESSETEPELVKAGESAAQDQYRREAKLVYRAVKRPNDPITKQLRQSATVTSYYLGAA